METICFFQDYLMNIWNRNLFFNFFIVNVFTVTFDKFKAFLLNRSISFFQIFGTFEFVNIWIFCSKLKLCSHLSLLHGIINLSNRKTTLFIFVVTLYTHTHTHTQTHSLESLYFCNSSFHQKSHAQPLINRRLISSSDNGIAEMLSKSIPRVSLKDG